MIAETDLSALRAAVTGPVLTAADADFEAEGGGYNLAVSHRPDVIVAATSAADVVATVGWAAEHGLPVAVQATGHGVTERMADGVLLKTSRMQDVEIDPERRTARIGAGVRWKTVLAQSVPHGLAGLCGSSSDVGVVGFTLGGGLPILGRAYGFAADRVRSIDVVTPDAQLRTVDADHEPELFEVLRGGKGNFGVVTALEFELVEMPEFYGGGLMYPGSGRRRRADRLPRVAARCARPCLPVDLAAPAPGRAVRTGAAAGPVRGAPAVRHGRIEGGG